MTKDSIEAFQCLATEKRTLLEARCQVGVFIQDMFLKDVEFAFEYENMASFDGLSEAEMLALRNPSLIRRSIPTRLPMAGPDHRRGHGSGRRILRGLRPVSARLVAW